MTMVIKVYRYAGRTRGRYPAFPPYGNDIESTYAEGCTVCPVLYHRHRAKQLNANANRTARVSRLVANRNRRRSLSPAAKLAA